jgi:hypothetical protein
MRALTRVGLDVPAELGDWSVPIIATVAARGHDQIPAGEAERVKLCEAIIEACRPFQKWPTEAAVRAWLRLPDGAVVAGPVV